MNQTLDVNSTKIINLIREQGSLSRVEICEKLDIPQSTVTRITNKLMKLNMLREGQQGHSSGGRRPIMLEVNENCFYALGIELGRSSIKVALINLNGELLSFRMKVTSGDESIQAIVGYVKEIVQEVKVQADILQARVLGVGVGLPGPLDETEDQKVSPPNFYGEKDIPLKHLLEEALELPVTLDNDANVATLAERWFGDGVGYRDFTYVMTDIGIGCGLMINGSLYRGLQGESGELGHMSIAFPGELCHCGNYGCLETLSSIPAIEETYHKMLGYESGLQPEEPTSFSGILQEAESGSTLAQKVLDQAAQHLGVGIANLINLFAPEKLIIGGTFSQVNAFTFDKIRSTAVSRVIGKRGKDIPIVKSKIEEAVVLGAGALIINQEFSLSEGTKFNQV